MVSAGINFAPTRSGVVAEPGEAGQLLRQERAGELDADKRRSWATQPIETIGCPAGVKRVDLAEDLLELKRERNAVVLAHNYQVPELQDLADYVGDSLGLSFEAKKTDADIILFCGVHFMAETAKIINPTKRVILPDLEAGCSLSESCPPEKLAAFLKQHAEKNYYVIAYINCSAGVKALADVICTSGNAEKIVRAAPQDRHLLFVPDQNPGAWEMERTRRKLDLWKASCYAPG